MFTFIVLWPFEQSNAGPTFLPTRQCNRGSCIQPCSTCLACTCQALFLWTGMQVRKPLDAAIFAQPVSALVLNFPQARTKGAVLSLHSHRSRACILVASDVTVSFRGSCCWDMSCLAGLIRPSGPPAPRADSATVCTSCLTFNLQVLS